MTSRNFAIAAVLVSAVAVAYLLGKNEALRESLNDTQKQTLQSSLVESLPRSEATSTPVAASSLAGKVVALADGDSFTLLDAQKMQHKVRIQGIDAPELGQAFSQESKQRLASLIFGKTVTVNSEKFDKYGRIVGKVSAGGQDVGRQMLSSGLAWFYRQYADELTQADRTAYEREEQKAKAQGIGLWAASEPVPPWEFRHPSSTPLPRATITEALPTPKPTEQPQAARACVIIGNTNSGIYHLPGCPSYNRVAPHNREYFCTEEDAQKAGFRKARNC